jgi:hypothetical protein
MSDARSKLSEALAKAENKRVAGAPASKSASKSASRPAPAKSQTSAPRAPAPKPKQTQSKPKPQKAPKPKKTGSGAPNAMFKSLSKFATNMLDELKTATSEISPAALLNTATDSIMSIKKAVGFDDTATPTSGQTSPPPSTFDETLATSSPEPSSPNGAMEHPQSPQPMSAPETSANASPKNMTSPAKVQRVASKKKSEPPAPAKNTEPTQEDLLKQLTSDTPIESTPFEEPPAPTSSPAKVKRVASNKSNEETSVDETDAGNEPFSEPTSETNQNDSPAADDPTDKSLTAETNQPADASEESAKSVKKPAPKPQAAAISKTEHAVRSFHALHSLLTNPLWAPIITNLEIKPSSLYAPRENFDSNFSDPVFRAGLKSASRLASTFGFEPEKMLFNQKLLEQIKTIEIDPGEKIKAHTENISSAIGDEKVKKILGIYHNKNFKHLLFSVATRMGSFVPTIESLARIYLSLRKKEPLSSGERLQIQEEILMRYRKAPYTEEMGKKARNLALNYFMDYMSSYSLKMYLDRFKDAPEGQDNIESSQRRHATIKAFCCNMIEEWAEKVALSSQAVMAMQAKFSDAADAHIEKLLSE